MDGLSFQDNVLRVNASFWDNRLSDVIKHFDKPVISTAIHGGKARPGFCCG